MDGPILIQACLNGARPPAAHPRLPITAEQIADDIRAVTRVGADAVHLHAKDVDGLDTLDPDTVDAVITAARVAAPAVPLSVTTGAWAMPDPADRIAAISAWSVLPDVASVNWHERGSLEVVEALLERGIGVEAGLWSMGDVSAWLSSPVRDEVRRVLIELPDGIGEHEVVALAEEMVAEVRSVESQAQILLHGEGASAWPALCHALRMGLQARIGLEDTLTLPDGEPATDNVQLVTLARALADQLG